MAAKQNRRKIGLLPRLLIAIALGLAVGLTCPASIIRIAATFNNLFGSFLGFCIPLIIIGFVVAGISDLGADAGKTLALTVGAAYLSTVFAGLLAYLVNVNVFPFLLQSGSAVMDVSNPEHALLEGFLQVEMPPVMGVMTALLLAFLLGIGISVTHAAVLKDGFAEFQRIISQLISVVVIPLLPFHVFGVFANMTYAGTVFEIMRVFIKVLGVIILLHATMILTQYTIACLVGKQSLLTSLKRMFPAYLAALGTQSSAASIPVTLACAKNNGVSASVANFSVPLCATIHLSGSTITITSCTMAIMTLSGNEVSLARLLPFILMLGVTMVAAPGVPGGAVMAALGILQSMLGFHETQITLMIALYLTQDSFGTACNVMGDGAIAILIDRFAGIPDHKKTA